MTANELAMRLHARRTGRGKWMALCPAHSDKKPSLAICVGRKVPVVLKCMSQGCETKDVLAALGLKWSDVFDSKPLDRKELQRLEAARLARERAAKADRVIVHDALVRAAHWYAEAEKLATHMAGHPDDPAAPYHEALRKARRLEAIADEFDDKHCRGRGVPPLLALPRPTFRCQKESHRDC